MDRDSEAIAMIVMNAFYLTNTIRLIFISMNEVANLKRALVVLGDNSVRVQQACDAAIIQS